MDGAFSSARCLACGRGLAFEEWRAGLDRCRACRYRPRRPVAAPAEPTPVAYVELVDDVSDELLAELVALLEEETGRRRDGVPAPPPAPPPPEPSLLARFLTDVFGTPSERETQWAAWGFALGFAGNVALAKAAQMASGAPVTEMVVPILLGGATAGGVCALIGWGLARLRDR